MTTNFNDLPWHDAILKYIYINRKKPATCDVIKLLIDWPDGSSSSTIEFCDCYALTANMNFGIVAYESILAAECITDSEELKSIYREWFKVGVELEKLKCFKIITNSTNSIINIYALNFQIENFSRLDCKIDSEHASGIEKKTLIKTGMLLLSTCLINVFEAIGLP